MGVLSPLTDADPAAVGTYRLQSRLGAGGMGTVYLGFAADNRPAAVKVIRPELASDPDFRARFCREVAVARRVHGSFVAEVWDADVDAEQPWMATEYVDGVSLAQAVADRGRLQGAMLTGLATGLADALVAVHAAGLVHRDLKPSNILLAWDGPKVIDFGIARDLESRDQTRTGNLIGTVAWMAPEQFLGERACPPADIFSWAACVAFAATGRHPFPGSTPTVSAFRSLNGEPDLGGVPQNLAALLRRALDRNPDARPSAVEVLSALLGEKVLGVADAHEATRRRLESNWVVPGGSGPGRHPDRAARLQPAGIHVGGTTGIGDVRPRRRQDRGERLPRRRERRGLHLVQQRDGQPEQRPQLVHRQGCSLRRRLEHLRPVHVHGRPRPAGGERVPARGL